MCGLAGYSENNADQLPVWHDTDQYKLQQCGCKLAWVGTMIAAGAMTRRSVEGGKHVLTVHLARQVVTPHVVGEVECAWLLNL